MPSINHFSLSSIILIMILLTAFGCSDNNQKGAITPVSESYFIFDTIATVKVFDENITDKHFKEIEEILEHIDSVMNRNREGSDIYKINQRAGTDEFTKVCEFTYFVVEQALHYAELTGGKFDPTVGPLVDLWSVTIEGATLPEEKYIVAAKELVNHLDVHLQSKEKSIRLGRQNMSLDLGGIAKGYAGDLIATYLIDNGFDKAVIDLGGDIVTLGTRPDGDAWRIGIQEPESDRGDYIGILHVNSQTVLTSGIYERYFMEDDVRYHHIFDPHTGYPVQNSLASVTIVTDISIDADVLATAVFAMGLEEGLSFIEGLEDMEAIFITQDNQVYVTSQLIDHLEITNNKYTLVQ